MAHIKSIVVDAGSYGSVGDITVRTIAGNVIASQKVSRRSGLFTYRQVLQQVRFANIMRAYSELNQSAPNGNGMYMAFPDRPEGLSNVNMFVRTTSPNPKWQPSHRPKRRQRPTSSCQHPSSSRAGRCHQ